MSGIRQAPWPSKYIVEEEYAGQDKFWSTDESIGFNDLLLMRGATCKGF